MKTKTNQLYRTLWRWHFYAGIFCIPFVLALAFSGAIYLFKPQIQAWIDRHYHQLVLSGQRADPSQHIAAAERHLPGAKFTSYRLPEQPDQAVVITVQQHGERQLVYVHPHTLDILKSEAFDSQFIRIVRRLHGELLLGTSGAVLVELAGCWAIVLVMTGLYLWWPRSAKGWAGILYPRLKAGGRRFWRDLHSVCGIWVAFFTLFLLISGLPWALIWGSVFKEIRTQGKASVSQDWQIGNELSLPPRSEITSKISTTLLQRATQLNFAPPVELAPDRQRSGTWKLSSGHQNRMLRADAWFDHRANLIEVRHFPQRPTVDKVIGIGISAHEGHLFGWLNQLLGLLVTLILVVVSISGFVLWRKRKPDAQLGAPPILIDNKLANSKLGKVMACITLVLALVLPVLAISMVIIFLIEKVLLSRMPRVKLWLGV